MSRFKRKTIEEPKKSSSGFADKYISMAKSKQIKTEPISKQDYFEANCHIARAMLKRFGRRPWMDEFIDEEGNSLNAV